MKFKAVCLLILLLLTGCASRSVATGLANWTLPYEYWDFELITENDWVSRPSAVIIVDTAGNRHIFTELRPGEGIWSFRVFNNQPPYMILFCRDPFYAEDAGKEIHQTTILFSAQLWENMKKSYYQDAQKFWYNQLSITVNSRGEIVETNLDRETETNHTISVTPEKTETVYRKNTTCEKMLGEKYKNIRGQKRTESGKFRAYENFSEAADDYGRFLNKNRRYKAAFDHKNDPLAFANEVAKAGYATAPDYGSTLQNIIKSYQLTDYE